MSRKACYCAFCKSPRKVYTKRNINLFNIMAAALGSGILMFAIWQEFDPKVFLIFVGFLALAEVFVQIRWRLNIVCKFCGFDPALYLRDQAQAAEKVRLHLQKRKNDPASLLAKPLNISKISKERADQAIEEVRALAVAKEKSRKGSLISRQI
jgi:hypothetical protein